MASLDLKIDEKMIKILQILRGMSYDERIPESVREEYMDKLSGIIEGE